jgi:hypothetical protein
MTKRFNTAGPCDAEIHYTVAPELRWDLDGILEHIARREYVAIHAPRQSGKTSCLLRLRDKLNEEGRYAAVYCNVEGGQAGRDDLTSGLIPIVQRLLSELDDSHGLFPDREARDYYTRPTAVFSAVGAILEEAAKRLQPRPLVVLFDEVDALVGDTLLSFLRQIRSSFASRPKRFPQSIFFCGMRNIQDYRLQTAQVAPVTGGSPFNITSKSVRLADFTRPMTLALLAQHTKATGQTFTEAAQEAIWHYTQGQPWLVNALADEACFQLSERQDATLPITPELINQAKERLILRRTTHLDQLAHKLEEPRVRAVIEPILAGENLAAVSNEDQEYTRDMGLIRKNEAGSWVVSNPVYQEIIPRELNTTAQVNVAAATIAPGWLLPTGKLDFAVLMRRFVDFWREHGEALMRSVPYHEVSAQLSLMAFLQRLINGGGRIHREYALGSGRMDLCIEYAGDKFGLEMKVWRAGRPNPLTKGLGQLDRYLDQLGLETGWLVIFDQRENPKLPGADLGLEEVLSPGGRRLTLVKA